MRIGILDYGVGNLYSLSCALKKLKVEPEIVTSPKSKEFDGIMLPGVGAFDAVTKTLGKNRQLLIDTVRNGVPVFGICLGMQVMLSLAKRVKETDWRYSRARSRSYHQASNSRIWDGMFWTKGMGMQC